VNPHIALEVPTLIDQTRIDHLRHLAVSKGANFVDGQRCGSV